MAEMLIQTPLQTRIVHDYDIIFNSGMTMPLTIDLDLGDTIDFTEQSILIFLSAKPSPNDPAKQLPSEATTVFLKHVIAIQHREREVVELSPGQKEEWHKVWQDLTSSGSTVQ